MSRPRVKRTAEAVKDYIDSAGGHCPCCGSRDIEPGRVQAARGRATGDFECFACHARWRDVYTLSTVEILAGQDRHEPPAVSAEIPAPTLDALLDAAVAADPGHTAVDLRALLRSAWRLMTPAQRTALSRERAFAELAAPTERGPAISVR